MGDYTVSFHYDLSENRDEVLRYSYYDDESTPVLTISAYSN